MNVVFDFGKVLFEWQPHELLARLLPERAADEASAHALVEQFFEGFGGEWGEFDRGTIESAPLAEGISRRTGLSVAQARSVIDAVPHELRPMEGMLPLLGRLRSAGHPLYFLSNMPAPYADHLEATHDFLGWFQDGVFSARVQLIKPDPRIFAHAAETFGILPSQTLFIDDVEKNVAAARTQGWQAIRFESATQCEAEMIRLGLF